jgi:hypothetical protein
VAHSCNPSYLRGRRIEVWSQPGQKASENPSWKYPAQKKGWQSGSSGSIYLKHEVLSSNPSAAKKKKNPKNVMLGYPLVQTGWYVAWQMMLTWISCRSLPCTVVSNSFPNTGLLLHWLTVSDSLVFQPLSQPLLKKLLSSGPSVGEEQNVSGAVWKPRGHSRAWGMAWSS